ncbi:MAG TPA: hypothetical protein VFW25_00510 [Silvibacterium sp.]|nr:hypothetical protein [Silvibacterium sp.]
MRPSSIGIAAMLVATCGDAGAQMAPQNTQSPENVQSTQSMPRNIRLVSADARLTRSVNSSKAAQGQMVSAKLTSDVKNAGTTELPKGTMLMGKVEQVKPSTNDGPSQLSVVFDQARLSNGRLVPIKATLLGAYPANTSDYWVDTTTSGSLMATQPRYIAADEKVDQEPGTLRHVSMHSSVQSNASGVFMNKDGNVNLKSGTRLQIAIAPMSNGWQSGS